MGNVLNNKTFQNVASEAGDVAVTTGNIYAYTRAIGTTIFFLIFLIVGIILVKKQTTKYIEVPGKISPLNDKKDVKCTSQIDTHSTSDDSHTTSISSTTTYNCNFNLTYTPTGGEEKTVQASTSHGKEFSNGQKVKVFYDAKDPNTYYIGYKPLALVHVIGYILLVFAVITFFGMICLWINVIIVSHSKVIAGLEGGAVGVGMVGGIARNVSNIIL
jgi:hypothetical protein|uniref:DUF3592 domain-containing protein n=1 Tax=viral metagenome TaxID=1070528 RepID=A0A6C0J276_9ZZZZ